MDFPTAAKFATLLSKDYAPAIFDLLVNYQAVSASEVAARLDLHIQTAQDFLEGLTRLGVTSKEEVLEKKRPYFRYVLQKMRILIDLDLSEVKRDLSEKSLSVHIREKENAGARFVAARNEDAIASVTIWSGNGREREERKIKLTVPQGKFLYHLPFPKAAPMSVLAILQKAGLAEELAPEILDLVQLLEICEVIESWPVEAKP
jgi:predicted transcriptional regulator